MRDVGRLLAAVSLMVVCASVCPAAQALEWWNADDFRRALRLTPDQVQLIDALFRKDLDARRQLKTSLDSAESEMERAIEAADEGAAFSAIDMVVELKREQNRARQVMLLRMAQALTPAQRQALAERKDVSRGKRRRPTR